MRAGQVPLGTLLARWVVFRPIDVSGPLTAGGARAGGALGTLSLALLSLLKIAAAQDEALYAAAPPPGSAFVRVVATTRQGSVKLGATDLGALAPGGASAYRPRPAGSGPVVSGALQCNYTAEAGQYYTVVLPAAGSSTTCTTLHDPAPPSRSKAGLVLYNLSRSGPLTLETADGAVKVIEALGAGALADRAVNALPVTLRVSRPQGPPLPLPELSLRRGGVWSVFVREEGNGLSVSVVENTTGA
jgi:alginate O-acetyltransferase complex protein AlgF